MYTVKQLSDLAGVTVRTLHYYDEIGLLRPSSVGENRYRYYGAEAAFRLQQIMFFRELGFALDEIQAILDRPGFDMLRALQAHRLTLQEKVEKLNRLITTVDRTIQHLKGEEEMSEQELFDGFTEEQERKYQREARQRYGDKIVDESYRRWNSYTPEKQKAIMADGKAILKAIVEHMDKGYDSPEVQEQVGRLHRQIGYFYECSYERFRGLGGLYREHPEFVKMYQSYHPDLPEFLYAAIQHYCQGRTRRHLDDSCQ